VEDPAVLIAAGLGQDVAGGGGGGGEVGVPFYERNKAEIWGGVTYVGVAAACWAGAVALGVATGGAGLAARVVCGAAAGATALAEGDDLV
jgi:hypothetical protein